MRRGVTPGIGCAVNRDKPRMHGMGGPASTGARGHEITVNVHLSGHLGHRARHGRHILNPEADGGRARGVRTRRQQSRQHQKHRICRQHSDIHDSSLDHRRRAGKQISSQNSLFHPFRNTAAGKRDILKKAPAHSHRQSGTPPRMPFPCPEKQNRPIKSRTGGLPTAISVHTLSSP